MNRTKKILLILGIAATLIGGVISTITYIKHSRENKINNLTKPMFSDIIQQKWSLKVIKKYASPRFANGLDNRSKTEIQQDNEVFAKLRKLGSMKNFIGVNGFDIQTNAKTGYLLANILIQFDKNVICVMQTAMIKINNKWYLDGFVAHKEEKRK